MSRTVLHTNIIHFYVSVTCLQAPRLIGYPVAIATPGARRTLLDISGEAWKSGISRGMTVDVARRRCPDLVLLDPAPSLYDHVERTLFEQACNLSPLVERAGPGHLFIDLTGTRRLFGGGADVADRFRKTIRNEFRIEPVVGIGTNRLVSKIATRAVKPYGLCSVIPGCEEEFMAPLSLSLLPGIDGRQIEQLLQFNLQLVRDLTCIPVRKLLPVIGPSASDITRLARGIDPTPIRAVGVPQPMVIEHIVLAEQTNGNDGISTALFQIVSRSSARVRAMGLAVGAMQLQIRYADGSTSARRTVLNPPVNGDLSLFGHASGLLAKCITRRVRLTELCIECTDLSFPYGQMDLFSHNEREEHLMSALDAIRNSFGRDAIRFWGREQAT